MIEIRSLSCSEPQRAISSNVRPQPVQRPEPVSITQTLMQGVETIAQNYPPFEGGSKFAWPVIANSDVISSKFWGGERGGED